MKQETKFKSELMTEFVHRLKQNGFKVYAFQKDEPITQVFIVKNNKIGTISEDYFYGLNFGTVHKPNSECGTGFRLNEEPIYEPSLILAEETFISVPYWSKDSKPVKYKSWEEYLKKNSILNYYEVRE